MLFCIFHMREYLFTNIRRNEMVGIRHALVSAGRIVRNLSIREINFGHRPLSQNSEIDSRRKESVDLDFLFAESSIFSEFVDQWAIMRHSSVNSNNINWNLCAHLFVALNRTPVSETSSAIAPFPVRAYRLNYYYWCRADLIETILIMAVR